MAEKLFLFLVVLLLTSCSHTTIVRDLGPPAIQTNYKRVETEICGRRAVGENGCVLTTDQPQGELKILRVYKGAITILGQACNVDYRAQYEESDDQWIRIPLGDLLPRISNDCILDIYQRVDFSVDYPFDQSGFRGTVTLGSCPRFSQCFFQAVQPYENWPLADLQLPESEGTLLVRSEGTLLLGPAPHKGPLRLEETSPSKSQLWVIGFKTATKHYKIYYKINRIGLNTQKLNAPSITLHDEKYVFNGDRAATLSLVNNKLLWGVSGEFADESVILRFFTINGRSLVVGVNRGKVTWVE